MIKSRQLGKIKGVAPFLTFPFETELPSDLIMKLSSVLKKLLTSQNTLSIKKNKIDCLLFLSNCVLRSLYFLLFSFSQWYFFRI